MPKVINHDAYREELVEQVQALFAEHSYGSLGMRQIARELAISKSALYHYFPTKEALFEAVCDRVVRIDLDGFARFVQGCEEGEYRLSTIIRYCEENEDWFVQQFLLLGDFLRDKSVQEIRAYRALQNAHREYLGFVQQFLELDSEEEARGILAFINGLILTRFLDGKTTDFTETAAWFARLVQSRKEGGERWG